MDGSSFTPWHAYRSSRPVTAYYDEKEVDMDSLSEFVFTFGDEYPGTNSLSSFVDDPGAVFYALTTDATLPAMDCSYDAGIRGRLSQFGSNSVLAPSSATFSRPLSVLKRPAPEDYDQTLLPVAKAIRKSYPITAIAEDERGNEPESDPEFIQQHFGVGEREGSYICACGNAYSRPYTLRRHVQVQSGQFKYVCLLCGKGFLREDSLRRHEHMKHEGKEVACPGCKRDFRPDYLPIHLESAQRGACKVIAEAIYLQTHPEIEIEAGPQKRDFWLYKSTGLATEGDRRLEPGFTECETASSQKGRPATLDLSSRSCSVSISNVYKPCDLCGFPLGPGEQELIDHVEKHSRDFEVRPYVCGICEVNFAFAADLLLHEEAAAKGHCGLNFKHAGGLHELLCSGHHPPCENKLFNDHQRMQVKLWDWEISQFASHRTTVARILAERLEYSSNLRRSSPGGALTGTTVLHRLSHTSWDSFRSVPAWLSYQDNCDPMEIDDAQPAADIEVVETSKRRGHEELIAAVTVESRSPNQRNGLPTPDSLDDSPKKNRFFNFLGSKGSHGDLFNAFRSAKDFGSKAPKMLSRAKSTINYSLPIKRHVVEFEQMQWIGTARA